MKAKDINTAINWGAGLTVAYFIGTAIAGAIKKHRSQSGANGIGDLTAWNKRHLEDFFENHLRLSKVIVDIAYRDDRGYIPVAFNNDDGFSMDFCVVSPNNIPYLKKLCLIYNVKYVEIKGDAAYFPNLHRV